MDGFITINQFARIYSISRATIYRENRAGRLPFVKIGRATRIRKSDASLWFEELSVPGVSSCIIETRATSYPDVSELEIISMVFMDLKEIDESLLIRRRE